jgi:putative flippase GtrA
MFNLLKFFLVGILNTIFGYAIFSIFIFIGLHYSLALLFSTILGILFNFKTIGKLVFNNNNNSLFLRFLFVYVLQYFLNIMSISLLSKFYNNLYITGFISTILVSIITYFLHKKIVYVRSK